MWHAGQLFTSGHSADLFRGAFVNFLQSLNMPHVIHAVALTRYFACILFLCPIKAFESGTRADNQ